MSFIQYTVTDRLAYITLDRAEKRNALNQELVEELKDVLDKASADENVKVIILKANGDAFCAGADLAYLKKLQSYTFEENLQDSRNLMLLYKKIYTLSKPVIAQVEGHAIAGGAGLATVCDLVYSVSKAKFGYTETKIGFVPAIVSVFLIRKIGETKAKELLLSGKIIDANTALESGIINGIFDKKEIRNKVERVAQELITQTSGHSLGITKELISKVQELSLDDALDYAARLNAKSRDHDDCKKGIAAFLNKEQLKW